MAAEHSIGADPASDLVLTDLGLAPRHGQLRLRGGVWTFADAGSDVGSWVDGHQVHGEVVLAPGSELRLGEATLAFAPADAWQDSVTVSVPAAPAESRAPLLVVPESSRSNWSTIAFMVILGAVIAAAVFLMRAH